MSEVNRRKIDLSTCEEGDTLISSLGAILKYVRPTNETEYLDHIVEYVELQDGSKPKNSMGTRTNDGYVFKHNRIPETDNDIVCIIKKKKKKSDELLILAEQQILGYYYANVGVTIKELVNSMGLTIDEWKILKKNLQKHI